MQFLDLLRLASLGRAVLVTALLTPAALVARGEDLPVRVLTSAEAEGLATSGATSLGPADLSLRSAASVSVSVPTKAATRRAARPAAPGTAAVYRGVPSDPRAVLPPWPGEGEVFDFKETSDSAQAWATMTSEGVPYLFVQGFGRFRSDATASWLASMTTAEVSSEVIVRFDVPKISVTGFTEQDAPALWSSRVRMELVVNGLPVWSVEPLRFAARHEAGPIEPHVDSFGQPLDFPGGAGSDSQAETVFLSLGTMGPGRAVDLELVVRASAQTADDALVAEPNDNACVTKSGEYFCSRATATVHGDPVQNVRVYLR